MHMQTSKIKAFGEVMMKLEVPDYMLLEQTSNLNVSYSGTGVNVLSGLSKFGHAVSLISCLPDTSVGNAALAHIRRLGIDTEDVMQKGHYIGQYILEKGFSVRPTNVVYSNRKESSFCLSDIADYEVTRIMANTAMIHFCGIMLAVSEQTRKLVLEMAKAAKEAGVTVVFDCNYRPKLWQQAGVNPRGFYEQMLSYADICMMTEKDALSVLGYETDQRGHKEQLEDVLPQVAEDFQIQVIAGTMRGQREGNQSLRGFICQEAFFAYSKNYVYNTLERIGAGDGFASGILHGLLEGYPAEKLIDFATAAGVLAHTVQGDSALSSSEDVWRIAEGDDISIER